LPNIHLYDDVKLLGCPVKKGTLLKMDDKIVVVIDSKNTPEGCHTVVKPR
jgi:hypothetical protein